MNKWKEIVTEDELMNEYVETLIRLPKTRRAFGADVVHGWKMTMRMLDCVDQQLYG